MNLFKYLQIPNSSGYSYNSDNGTYSVTFAGQEPRLITDNELLAAIKLQKTDELKTACKTAIESGFTSNALGAVYWYDSSLPQDQTNLVGARLAGVDMNFTCTDVDGVKTERLHTAAQIAQVFVAGMVHLQTQKANFYSRISALNNAAALADVESVVW